MDCSREPETLIRKALIPQNYNPKKSNPETLAQVYHSKRLIGCKYGEKVLQDAANLRWPFKVVDVEGGAGIQITVCL